MYGYGILVGGSGGGVAPHPLAPPLLSQPVCEIVEGPVVGNYHCLGSLFRIITSETAYIGPDLAR